MKGRFPDRLKKQILLQRDLAMSRVPLFNLRLVIGAAAPIEIYYDVE